jgi:hypothetical protein
MATFAGDSEDVGCRMAGRDEDASDLTSAAFKRKFCQKSFALTESAATLSNSLVSSFKKSLDCSPRTVFCQKGNRDKFKIWD